MKLKSILELCIRSFLIAVKKKSINILPICPHIDFMCFYGFMNFMVWYGPQLTPKIKHSNTIKMFLSRDILSGPWLDTLGRGLFIDVASHKKLCVNLGCHKPWHWPLVTTDWAGQVRGGGSVIWYTTFNHKWEMFSEANHVKWLNEKLMRESSSSVETNYSDYSIARIVGTE